MHSFVEHFAYSPNNNPLFSYYGVPEHIPSKLSVSDIRIMNYLQEKLGPIIPELKIHYRRNDSIIDATFVGVLPSLYVGVCEVQHPNYTVLGPVKCIAKLSGKTDRTKEKRCIPERVIIIML